MTNRSSLTLGSRILLALSEKKWNQRQLATEIYRTEATLSDYISGKTRPPPDIIGQIAAILEIDPVELAELVGYEDTSVVLAAYEWRRWPWPTLKAFLDEAYNQVLLASFLRDHGSPHEAHELLKVWTPRLEDRLRIERRKRNKDLSGVKSITTILAQAYNEQMACNTETESRTKVLQAIGQDFIRGHRQAIAIGDSEQEAWAEFWMCGGYYIAHSYERSAELAQGVLAKSKSPALLAETNRILVLDYSLHGQREKFEEAEREALKLMDKTGVEPFDRAALLEGMGRGRAVLGLPGGESRLTEAEQECEAGSIQGKSKTVRRLQINRSKLIEIAQSEKPDKEKAVEVARSGLLIAREHGYLRHIVEIGRLAGKLGISHRLEDLLEANYSQSGLSGSSSQSS